MGQLTLSIGGAPNINPTKGYAWLWLAIGVLWLQLFWALVPTWRDGLYYEYGWFVPVLAAGLAWRRWQGLDRLEAAKIWVLSQCGKILLAASIIGFIALLVPLRMIAVADPTWRPPLLLHVLMVAGLSHLLIWSACGPRIAWKMIPVTVFALSAAPYPWRFELELISRLTSFVVSATHEVFLLIGQPVELSGNRLILRGEVAEVTEGCSGIRSLQSLVMVALFFGELLDLSVVRRIVLLLTAGGCAMVVNTLRAYSLAAIQFDSGREAAEAAHDWIGQVAFVGSSAILFCAALLLLRFGQRRAHVIRRIQVGGGGEVGKQV